MCIKRKAWFVRECLLVLSISPMALIAESDARLLVSNSMSEVFAAPWVEVEESVSQMHPSDIPLEHQHPAGPKDIGAIFRSRIKERNIDFGRIAEETIVRQLDRAGLIILDQSRSETAVQMYVGVHDIGFAQRFPVQPGHSGSKKPRLETGSHIPRRSAAGSQSPPRLKELNMFPVLHLSIDLLNSRQELIWSREAKINKHERMLLSATADELINDTARLERVWREAVEIAARQVVAGLAEAKARPGALGPKAATIILPDVDSQRGPPFLSDSLPVKMIAPEFPAGALHARTGGEVRLELEIAEDGRVASVISAIGKPAGFFEESATRALRMWRFQAAKDRKGPARYRTQYSLMFGKPP
jgi:TonB family protein